MQELTLKARLVQSLEELSKESAYRRKIETILQDLNRKDVIIPETDHEKVIRFVLCLMKSMPALLDNNPNDKMLRALCQDCMRRISIASEIKTRYRRNP